MFSVYQVQILLKKKDILKRHLYNSVFKDRKLTGQFSVGSAC